MSQKQVQKPSAGLLEKLQEVLLHEPDLQKRLVTLRELQNLLRNHGEDTALILYKHSMTVVDCIVDIVKAGRPDYEELSIATEIVSLMCSNQCGMTNKLEKSYDIVAVLAKLLSKLQSEEPSRGTDHYLSSMQFCVWAIGNLAADGPLMSMMVLQSKVAEKIIEIADRAEALTVRRAAVWALRNFVTHGDVPEELYEIIPTMFRVLSSSKDQPLVSDALWALIYLTDDSYECQKRIWSYPNSFEIMSEYLKDKEARSSLVPVLRLIAQSIAESDEYALEMVQKGIIPLFLPLLAHSSPQVRQLTLTGISYVLSGDGAQTALRLHQDLLPSLIHVILSDQPLVAKEAGRALLNAIFLRQHLLLAVQTPRFFQAFAACLLNERLSLVACEACMVVIQCTQAICGESQENCFLEYLRIQCGEYVDSKHASGEGEAKNVSQLFDAFHTHLLPARSFLVTRNFN